MALAKYTQTFHTETYPAISVTRPELSSAGKLVLITGGGSGIGPRMAHAFATAGSTEVSILGRTSSSLLNTKKEIEAAHPGTKVHISVADILDASAVEAAFAGAEKEFGKKVDILVSNAGYLPDLGSVADADIDEWFKGMEVNVKGGLIVAQAFLKHSSEHPTFIHISTGAAHAPAMPGPMSAYAVSKLAAAKMMDYVAVENAHVRVHVMHPGVIDTAMSQKSSAAGLVLPIDDGGLPASFVVWLASPEAEFLKGKFVWSNWDVDELKAKREHLLSSPDLTLGLLGWA